MKKICVLFSGGTESTLMLEKYLDDKYEVHALYIRSGYSYEVTELLYARKTIKYFKKKYSNKIKFKEINLSELSPKELGIVKNQKQNIIPLRRMFLTTVASMYISHNNIKKIAIGSQNSPQYPDGNTEYIETLEKLLLEGLDEPKFKLKKPFFYLTKEEILNQSKDKNLINYIFSCVNPVDNKMCGECYKCKSLNKVKLYNNRKL